MRRKDQQEVSPLLDSSLLLQGASHLFSCSLSQSHNPVPVPMPNPALRRRKEKKTSQKLTAGLTVPVRSLITDQTSLAQRRVQNAGIGDRPGSRNIPTTESEFCQYRRSYDMTNVLRNKERYSCNGGLAHEWRVHMVLDLRLSFSFKHWNGSCFDDGSNDYPACGTEYSVVDALAGVR
jgi:hypothetical protein